MSSSSIYSSWKSLAKTIGSRQRPYSPPSTYPPPPSHHVLPLVVDLLWPLCDLAAILTNSHLPVSLQNRHPFVMYIFMIFEKKKNNKNKTGTPGSKHTDAPPLPPPPSCLSPNFCSYSCVYGFNWAAVLGGFCVCVCVVVVVVVVVLWHVQRLMIWVRTWYLFIYGDAIIYAIQSWSMEGKKWKMAARATWNGGR